MRNRKSIAPRLEPMESRELFAVAPFVGPLPLPVAAPAPAITSPFIAPITGSIAGHYTKTISGGTTTVALSGTGSLNPLGAVTLSATIVNSGDDATGSITLKGASGKVTLSLTPYVTGPVHQFGDTGPAIPEAYIYTVTSATGSYSNTTGRGIVNIGIGTAASGSDTITFSNIPRITPQ